MRLVCPNCDAQYEVADTAIPDSGRDVQCSNCGHTWFQQSPRAIAEAEAEAALFGDDIAPPAGPVNPPAPAAAPTPFPEEDDEDMGYAAAPAPAAAAPAPAPVPEAAAVAPKRKELDESLIAVLREEAERETQARKQEAAPMEVQGDLGLPPAAPMSPTARRLAMLKGQNPDAPPPAPAKPAARRDLLPDVEEINSTLRSTGTARQDDDADADVDALPDLNKPRSGFRSGFSLMILLAVVALVAYVAAPTLSAQFPQAAPALAGYVAFVDQMRVTLDGLMQAATNAINGQGS